MNLIEVSVALAVTLLVSTASLKAWVMDAHLFYASEQQSAVNGCAASVAESVLTLEATGVTPIDCSFTYQVTPTTLGSAVTVWDGSFWQRVEVIEHANVPTVSNAVYRTIPM